MKFKIDENLGKSAAKFLIAAGHDVDTVFDENLSGAPDDKIFTACIKQKRCLITLDLDFSNILRFPPYDSPGIIILRPQKYFDISQILMLLNNLIRTCITPEPAGSIWIIESDKIRIHSRDAD